MNAKYMKILNGETLNQNSTVLWFWCTIATSSVITVPDV